MISFDGRCGKPGSGLRNRREGGRPLCFYPVLLLYDIFALLSDCFYLAAKDCPVTPFCPSCSLAELASLTDLYNTTGGPEHWTVKWDLKKHPSTWFGVTIEGNRVTYDPIACFGRVLEVSRIAVGFLSRSWLKLMDNNLKGSIPESIGILRGLRWLHLDKNKLTGEIPTSIGNLTNLAYVLGPPC